MIFDEYGGVDVETLKVGELKTNFSTAVKKIRAGKEIVICFGKKDEKVAVLVPYGKYKGKTPRSLGVLRGKAEMTIGKHFSMTDEELLSS
jgi:antitoxin (DNA-binding transcriptional repressor) of toxin-antitoxin stability system